MEYIIIISAIVIILAFVFLRKHDDSQSDYKEPEFKHSGKQWVFNGILDIDHPPLDQTPFKDYEGALQLMVKKGYLHYSLELMQPVQCQPGLYRGQVKLEEDKIVVLFDNLKVGYISSNPKTLAESINQKGGVADAYGFIATKDGEFLGEVCIQKR